MRSIPFYRGILLFIFEGGKMVVVKERLYEDITDEIVRKAVPNNNEIFEIFRYLKFDEKMHYLILKI